MGEEAVSVSALLIGEGDTVESHPLVCGSDFEVRGVPTVTHLLERDDAPSNQVVGAEPLQVEPLKHVLL